MSRDLRFAGDTGALIRDQHAVDKFNQGQRNGESPAHQHEQADPITSLLLYLADGYECGNLAVRAAVFLVFVRPELLSDSSYRSMAKRLGVNPSSFVQAVRLFRETVPALTSGFSEARTSKNRLLSLGQIRLRRRKLWLEHIERMAEARRIASTELARMAVKEHRRRSRDSAYRKRLRVARATIALAGPILKAQAAEMARFDEELGINPYAPDPYAHLLKGGAP